MAAGRAADSKTLVGWRVLVTRPPGRADALAAALQRHGAQVFAAPLLTIEHLPFSPTLREISQNLERHDVVIVTSINAVRAWLPHLADFWPQWPAAQSWFAVGTGTAAALAEFGIHATVPAEATSEGLLALPALNDVTQRRVLLVAGEGGRDAIENTLRARGALLTRLETYRRVANDAARATVDAFADNRDAPASRAVLVTSATALQNLLALAPWLRAGNAALIVASERIARLANDAGITSVVVAGGADDENQVSALLQLAKGKPDEECA